MVACEDDPFGQRDGHQSESDERLGSFVNYAVVELVVWLLKIFQDISSKARALSRKHKLSISYECFSSLFT